MAKPKPLKEPKPTQEKMFDTAVPALEKLAEKYVEARDQRQAYLTEEVGIKTELLAEMKKRKTEHYVRDGIEIHVVHENEKVRVRIKKEADDETE